MLEGHVERCIQRISHEEAMAREALTPEMALAHSQAAMILKSEVAILQQKRGEDGSRTATVGQMLAEIW